MLLYITIKLVFSVYIQFLKPEEICCLVVDSYNKKSGVFRNRVNAEDFVPRATKRDQVQFLFWVIQMDYATKSQRLYQNALQLWNEDRDWYDAMKIFNCSNTKLKEIIKSKFKPRYANEITKRFKYNSELLIRDYDGYAINLVKSALSAEDLLNKIRYFRGFGPKLGNFLFRTFISVLNPKYKDLEDILMPVDIHDVRLSYRWGFINNSEMSSKNIKKVKHIWNIACKKAEVSWIVFDRALWLLGSEGKWSGESEDDFYRNIGLHK